MQLYRRQSQRLSKRLQCRESRAFPLQHSGEEVPRALRLRPGNDQRHAAQVALDDVTLLARKQRQLFLLHRPRLQGVHVRVAANPLFGGCDGLARIIQQTSCTMSHGLSSSFPAGNGTELLLEK